MGCKEIKIKAIAQALPVYIMSMFKVPAGLYVGLTMMIRVSSGEQRKVSAKPIG